MHYAPTALKVGALGLLATFVIAACGGSDATPTPEPTPSPAPAIEVTGNAFAYDPADVTIPAEGSSTIRLVNTDVVEHDWTIDELDIKIEAPLGGTGEAVLSDIAPGNYAVHCTVPGHTEAGMVGTLTVTE